MEPIIPVTGPRGALEAAAPVAAIVPRTREEREAAAEKRRRPRRPRVPARQTGVHAGDDGHVHVDIEA